MKLTDEDIDCLMVDAPQPRILKNGRHMAALVIAVLPMTVLLTTGRCLKSKCETAFRSRYDI